MISYHDFISHDQTGLNVLCFLSLTKHVLSVVGHCHDSRLGPGRNGYPLTVKVQEDPLAFYHKHIHK